MLRNSRFGFTLLEVLVALAIGAVALVATRGLIDGLALQASRVARDARFGDEGANSEALLRGLILRLALHDDATASFEGTADSALFSSWCDAAGGWQEPCMVQLALVRVHDGSQVAATLSIGDSVHVPVAGSAHFAYLVSANDGGIWRARWDRSMLTPLAIGIASDRDTTIYRIGERR